MGKNNKARRAAKAKQRAKDRKGAGQGGDERFRDGASAHRANDGPIFTERESTSYLLHLSARTLAEKGDPSDLLEHLGTIRSSVVAEAAEELLAQQVAACWDGGWQPAELLRQGRRDTASAGAGRLVTMAIATDNAGRRATSLDARWMQQVERLDLPPVDGRSGWIRRWITDEGLAWPSAVVSIVDAIRALTFIPRIPEVLPPPGSPQVRQSRPLTSGDTLSNPVLDKIRNLLAKAESTDFEAEATAFTAKAQELMTRHAIDAASIERDPRASNEEPVMIRLMIDPPYVDAKGLLLHVVAEANRCRAVAHSSLDMCSVVGFEADVAAVEILFTSLLVQAQTALVDAARRAPAGTRVRSQAFRSSFLTAFADRIGDRLRQINEHLFDEAAATGGTGFQVVLRARSSAVDDAIDDRFGELTSARVRRSYDAAGHASGRVAADQAQLNFGDLRNAATAGGDDIDLTDRLSRDAEIPPLLGARSGE